MVPLGPLPPAGRLARLTVLDIVPATLSFEQLARLQVDARRLLAFARSHCSGFYQPALESSACRW
jgi:hypothetical protein